MTRRQPTLQHVVLNDFRQSQQPQHIGDVRPRLANHLSQRVLGAAKAVDQHLVATGFFDRIEIGALHIFDDADLKHFEIVHVAHDHRHGMQARLLRRTPATFAGDDLKLPGLARRRPNQQRQQYALFADGGGQVIDIGIGEHPARLIRIAHQQFDGLFHSRRCRTRLFNLGGDGCDVGRRVTQQGRQTAAQASLFF